MKCRAITGVIWKTPFASVSTFTAHRYASNSAAARIPTHASARNSRPGKPGSRGVSGASGKSAGPDRDGATSDNPGYVMKTPFDFSGYRVLVAGGSRGIGRAVVLGFLEAGASVCVCARGKDGLD